MVKIKQEPRAHSSSPPRQLNALHDHASHTEKWRRHSYPQRRLPTPEMRSQPLDLRILRAKIEVMKQQRQRALNALKDQHSIELQETGQRFGLQLSRKRVKSRREKERSARTIRQLAAQIRTLKEERNAAQRDPHPLTKNQSMPYNSAALPQTGAASHHEALRTLVRRIARRVPITVQPPTCIDACDTEAGTACHQKENGSTCSQHMTDACKLPHPTQVNGQKYADRERRPSVHHGGRHDSDAKTSSSRTETARSRRRYLFVEENT